MKSIKIAAFLLVMAFSISSCVVRERRAGWVPAHYEYGPYVAVIGLGAITTNKKSLIL